MLARFASICSTPNNAKQVLGLQQGPEISCWLLAYDASRGSSEPRASPDVVTPGKHRA